MPPPDRSLGEWQLARECDGRLKMQMSGRGPLHAEACVTNGWATGRRGSLLEGSRAWARGPTRYQPGLAGPTVGATLAALIKASLEAEASIEGPRSSETAWTFKSRALPFGSGHPEVAFRLLQLSHAGTTISCAFRRSVRSASSWSRVVRDWTADDLA